MHRHRRAILAGVFVLSLMASRSLATTYYIAPSGGSDANPGTSSAPWATFAHAMTVLRPGDVLLLKDGTYHHALNITVSGAPGNPIMFRAENDGLAIVDAQGTEVSCRIYNSPTSSNRWHDIVVEGIVFRNSSADVVMIGRADGITVRRVSGYNAGSATSNYHVFALSYSTNVLLEDCAASGSGRSMYTLYFCDNSVVRRCWGRWTTHVLTPYFFLQVYNSNDTVVENCVGTKDPASTKDVYGMSIRSNKEAVNTANNNRLYGNVVYEMTNAYYRVESDSFKISGNRLDHNVAIQTNTNNQEWDYFYINADDNLVVDHQTIIGFYNTTTSSFGNGVVFEELATPREPGFVASAVFKNSVLAHGHHGLYANYTSAGYAFNNSYNDLWDLDGQMYRIDAAPGIGEISLDPLYNTNTYGKGAYLIAPAPLRTSGENGGMGAEVLFRYQDGSLTNVPLWPWPMENRILAETGVSVTWESNGGLWKSLSGVYSTDNPPASGWSVQHIVDVDDVIFGINQSTAPRDNRSLALSADKNFLYLGYLNPSGTRIVRKIDLSVTPQDGADNHSAVVAQLLLPSGSAPAYALATDDRGRVYLARSTQISVYNSSLSTLLHTISGFNACEGVAARRENGTMAVYATDRSARKLKRYALTEEGVGDAIISSTKAGLDGDGEVSISGAKTPRGVDVQSDGTVWIADNSAGPGKVFRLNANGRTVGNTKVVQAYDLVIDENRGEVYVSQNTDRALTVLNLSNGAVNRTLTPPAANLNIDPDGENGSGALTGIDADEQQHVYVANEKGRSILTGNPPDSPFSNAGDDHVVYAADTDPVLLISGTVLAKSNAETSLSTEGVTTTSPVTDYELAPAYPNPFWSAATSPARSGGNPETKIAFALPEAGKVALRIYTTTGQLVRTVIDAEKNAGWHETVWNGRDEYGRFVASGVYLYRLTVASPALSQTPRHAVRGNVVFAKTRKMTMLK